MPDGHGSPENLNNPSNKKLSRRALFKKTAGVVANAALVGIGADAGFAHAIPGSPGYTKTFFETIENLNDQRERL